MKKEELLKQLRELELKEQAEKDEKRKAENFRKFQERPDDWMIGKAHADLDFILKPYASDRNKALLPNTVSITGNCGTSFRGEAPVTESTHTFFRNVWNTNYTRNEEAFQEKLNKMVRDEVAKICHQLPVVLEMMGLQSLHYWVTEQHFPKDKLPEVKQSIEQEQAKILDQYSDDEFIKLIRKQNGWVDSENNPVPEHKDVDLSHSRMILYRYIFKNRPSLQAAFRDTSFYESWKSSIEAESD